MVGGQAPKAIRSVECYDFEEERWDQVAELPSRRCRAGNGNACCNLFCFPGAALQGWMDVLSCPFSLPLCPRPQAALCFCPSFLLFPCTHVSFSFRSCSCLSALRSHCLPFITSLSWLLLGQYFPSSSRPARLAVHGDPAFCAGFLVKIKGAESGPLSAEEVGDGEQICKLGALL